MATNFKYKKEQVAEALKLAKGNVSQAAKSLSCGRGSVYRCIDRNPELQDLLEDARETWIDFAESKLQEQITKNNMTAIIFFLKTQAKHRGYVERPEPGTEFDDTETVVTMDMGKKTLRMPDKIKAIKPSETTH